MEEQETSKYRLKKKSSVQEEISDKVQDETVVTEKPEVKPAAQATTVKKGAGGSYQRTGMNSVVQV